MGPAASMALPIVAIRAMFWIASSVVAVLLLLPGTVLPTTNLSDKIEHLLAFFALASLGATAYPGHRSIVAIGLIASGSALEAAQVFVPNRLASMLDALANSTGVALGVIFVVITSRLISRSR